MTEAPFEFIDRHPTVVKTNQTIVDEMEMDEVGKPDKRRIYRVSSNYHRLSAALEMLFSGKISG